MDLGAEAIDTFERFPEGIVEAVCFRKPLVGSQTSKIDGLSDKTWRVTFVAPGLCKVKVSLIDFWRNPNSYSRPFLLLTNIGFGIKSPGCSFATQHFEPFRERNSLSDVWAAAKIVDDRSGLVYVVKLSIRILIVPKFV